MSWFKGKRTLIFNGIVASFGILEAADLSVLPDEYEGYIIIAIALIGMWLRLLTTTPVGGEK